MNFLKKYWKKITIGILASLALVGGVFYFNFARNIEDNLALMRKADQDLIGKRLELSIDDQPTVHGNFYSPEASEGKLPLIINIHGGAFISGDADTLDSQSQRLSQENQVAVFTLDYRLLAPYQMMLGSARPIKDQAREAVNAALYFKQHAADYQIDPEKIILLGYSAGGHIALAATQLLVEQGESILGQIIAYGYLRDGLETYEKLGEAKKELPETLVIYTTTEDWISESMRDYALAMKKEGVSVTEQNYPQAQHGFLEENNPEYDVLEESPARNPEQAGYAVQAENLIKDWLAKLLSKN